MAATTVDEVLAELDGIVDHATRERSRLGYFAALYRTATADVQQGLQTDFFDDGDRMERLTLAFARRYFDAYEKFRRGEQPSRSWQVAFDAGARWRPLVLQQLLAGINAHINLDLGIAAAETAPGERLADLRRDFDRINEILGALVEQVQARLAEVSPWMRLLDRVGGRGDGVLVRFSLAVARTQAWRFATELAPVASDAWAGAIQARDDSTARLGRCVLHPGVPLSAGLLVIRAREGNDIRRNLEVLARMPPPALATVEARIQDQRAH